MIYFLSGVFLGVFVGFTIASLLQVAKRDDDNEMSRKI